MKYFYSFLFFLILFSCSKGTVDIENFDEAKWKQDPNGCKGDRMEMIDRLVEVKDQLKALDQDHLIALIGKPDRQELYKRSQKFLYYQISPDESCTDKPSKENIYLSIRFNATGLSKEIIVMNYMP